MNRKLIAILTALLLAASLCACNNEPDETEESTDPQIVIPGGSDTESSTIESETFATDDTETVETETEPIAPVVFVEKKDTVYVLAQNQAVNLRTDTTLSDASIYTSVPNGTELQRIAISEDGTWSKVIYDGNELYVKSNFLTGLSDVDAGFVAISKTLTVKAAGLNVRIAPYNAGETPTDKVGSLTTGDVITVLAVNADTGWYKIQYNLGETVVTGYVVSNAEYFEPETDAFSIDATGYTVVQVGAAGAVYQNADRVLIIATDTFETLKDDSLSAKDYAELVVQTHALETEIKFVNNVASFEYEATAEGVTYHYIAYTYVGEEGYWLVQFASATETFESYRSEFEAIAKTFKA